MSKPNRAKLRESFLAQLPENATEAEKVVYVENQFSNHVWLLVSRKPFSDPLLEEDILETIDGIRKRTVENRMRDLARRYPGAYLALFSDSEESAGMPIYIRDQNQA